VHIERIRFRSEHLHRTLEQVIVLPRDFERDDHRPMIVFLHGRKGHPSSPYDTSMVEALGSAGTTAPVILLVNGGSHSYFHDRDDGAWGSYITKDLVPAMSRTYGIDTERIGYAGVSMGGYGALELTRGSTTRRCGVVGIAPALWLQAGDSAPGAFDDAEDFDDHDVLGAIRSDARHALHGTPVWLAGGDRDPFKPGTDAAAAALRDQHESVVRRTGHGGHDGAYFHRQYLPMLRWFIRRFTSCGQ
jgi:S-formylglutathione hydrolase FrmB